MTVLAITRHQHGPRCHLFGWRVHHGSAGAALASIGITLRQPAVVVAGLLLVWHDRRDFTDWLPRRR